MWPDLVSNPGPPTYESGALPTALRGSACLGGLNLPGISVATLTDRPDITMDVFSNKAHCWKTSCQC